MPETIIESVLNGKLDSELLKKWLNNESIDDAPDDCILHCCKKNEFVAYFLTFLRNQTDSILQTNTNAVQILQNSTPEKLRQRKHHRSISEPTTDDRSTDTLSVKTDSKSHESPNRDRKRPGRRVKTKLFSEDRKDSNISISSDESRLSTSIDKQATSSTPLKNGTKASDYPQLSLTSPLTPRGYVKDSYERCDTPRVSRHSRSHEKSCLGDYIVNATKSSKKKSKKNTSSDKEEKTELDISNSEMFPEIGARKSSSLRSDKRRIKPTNIDKSQKSLSLNSFNSDCFQSSPLLPENKAFKQDKYEKETNNFDTERNILKQERHKLMEKFNILNTSTTKKPTATPQIKITQKEIMENPNYIKVDPTKILLKDKIDFLIDLYSIMLKNNLILSINTEIYFLISILISKQCEDEYLMVEKELLNNNYNYILQSINNCTYFAVKSLWNERATLEVILDKNSLKTLGENKKVRLFSPDLAKCLLNCYCVRSEAAPVTTHPPPLVAFNVETDNIDNFSSNNQYHVFKKQRDMFHEIVRWYNETKSSSGACNLRSRVRSLVCVGSCTHSHLATLYVQHLLCTCLYADPQESKLTKLQRRLTCPTSSDSHRLPHFTASETFYKEFILHAENESFRANLRDVLSTEIIMLDNSHITTEDRGNSKNTSMEYLKIAKKLALLAKFLGFLTSLPYCQLPSEFNSKTNNVIIVNKDHNYTAPKDKVLENNIALRNYSQPNIDLKRILDNAIDNSRVIITVPWLVHYLSMLDYTTLRLKYYQNILRKLLDLYHNRLKNTQKIYKKNTVIYLKSILGWLFDLPHFPADLIESNKLDTSVGTESVDSIDLIDESIILELCPNLKDVNNLLLTCRLTQDGRQVGSFRHITPVSLNINPEDRIKSKEKELQSRLEEEFVRSLPSSWRRILEVVCERALSTVVREVSATLLPRAVRDANKHVSDVLHTLHGDQASRLTQITAIYNQHLERLRSSALEVGSGRLRTRTKDAISALLPTAPTELHIVAYRNAKKRLNNWLNEHWNTTAVLCKHIESRLNMSSPLEPKREVTPPPRVPPQYSIASHLIDIKEAISLLLEDTKPNGIQRLLSMAALVARDTVGMQRKTHVQLTVDLCVVYVAKRPKEVTESFLSKFHAIWHTYCPDRKPNTPEELTLPERRPDLSPELRNFDDEERVPTPISDDENGDEHTKKAIIIQNTGKTQQNTVLTLQNTVKINQNLKTRRAMSLSPCATPLSPGARPLSPSARPLSPLGTYSQSATPLSPKGIPLSPKAKSLSTSASPLSPNTVHSPNKTDANSDESEQLLEYFNRILCPRNIVLFTVSNSEQSCVWNSLANLLVFLLKNDFLSEDSLTEQCLAVYRQDWNQTTLSSMSVCMKSVSSRWGCARAGKFTLFLEFLAEYCGDMAYDVDNT